MHSVKSLLSHFDLNVSDYKKSVLFYDQILLPLGWKKINSTRLYTAYTDGVLKLVLCPTEERFRDAGFHRKRVGLNHIAFSVPSRAAVDQFFNDVLKPSGIELLYSDKPTGDDEYYAVFFEDPDRVKLEIVYAPNYCSHENWPNNLKNDFDPYTE